MTINFFALITFVFRSGNARYPLLLGVSRVNLKFFREKLRTQGKLEGSLLTVYSMSSTHIMDGFKSCVSSVVNFSAQ